MPTYIRPARVDITEGGGWIGPLAMIGAAIAAIAALVAFIAAHLVLLAACLVACAVVLGTFLGWSRWIASPARLAEARVAERLERAKATAVAATVQQAIPAGPRAIAPAVHHHLHLHGLTAEDAVTIARALEGGRS